MKYILMLCLGLSAIHLYAQKIPNTQEKSIWVKGVKVDGKLDDWGKELSAYNKENSLWYSIANDDKFLYLAVKKDKFPTKAYARGGIKLFISTKEVKFTNGLPAISFPVPIVDGKSIPREEWNEIDVRNISGLTDTLISVYNEVGIQVGFNLEETDKGKVYSYELAVPLKLFGIRSGQIIYYNMLLRGNTLKQMSPAQAAMIANIDPKLNPFLSKDQIQQMNDSMIWSEFWASYQLATSP